MPHSKLRCAVSGHALTDIYGDFYCETCEEDISLGSIYIYLPCGHLALSHMEDGIDYEEYYGTCPNCEGSGYVPGSN